MRGAACREGEAWEEVGGAGSRGLPWVGVVGVGSWVLGRRFPVTGFLQVEIFADREDGLDLRNL